MTDEKGNFVCPDLSQETRLFPAGMGENLIWFSEYSASEGVTKLIRSITTSNAGCNGEVYRVGSCQSD